VGRSGVVELPIRVPHRVRVAVQRPVRLVARRLAVGPDRHHHGFSRLGRRRNSTENQSGNQAENHLRRQEPSDSEHLNRLQRTRPSRKADTDRECCHDLILTPTPRPYQILRTGKAFWERGRESFSEEASSMWLAVARKRLPTPFALRTTKPNPTVIVLPVLRCWGLARPPVVRFVPVSKRTEVQPGEGQPPFGDVVPAGTGLRPALPYPRRTIGRHRPKRRHQTDLTCVLIPKRRTRVFCSVRIQLLILSYTSLALL
jgi:hypothetical protein